MVRQRWDDFPNVGNCILWFAGVGWDAVRGTDRNLVEALEMPVVWVDMPRSPLIRGGRWRPAPWGGVEVVRDDPLIIRITPAVLPFSYRAGIRCTASPLKRGQVRMALRGLGASPQAVVHSYLDPTTRRWGEDPLEVLLGTDDFVSGARLMGISSAWLEECERRSLVRVDMAVAVTDALAERWRSWGVQTQVLPNGCSPLSAESISLRESVSDERSRRPVAGLVGQLSERIDIGVLESVVDSGIDLLLVGPVDPRWEPDRFADLVGREHVEYVGPVPASRVPDYLLRMDVGLTPYVGSDFNRASFPLKTLEYLGAGVPVVTTDLPASKWLRADMEAALGADAVKDHLRVVPSGAEFPSAIKELALARSREFDLSRWSFAQRHSWRQRAGELTALLARGSDSHPVDVIRGF